MTKENGLGDGLYVDGIDLSGDIGAMTGIASPRGITEVTGIDKFAFERLLTHKDGAMGFNAWFNPTTAHLKLNDLPTVDVIATYRHGATIGKPAANMVGKQLNYDGTRAQDGSFPLAVSAQANGFGLEWAEQLTDGTDTLTGAGSLASLDYGAAIGTTAFGLQAYLQVMAFTGTSATVNIQHSSDNAVGDPFATVTGGSFVAATAIGAQRIQTSRTESIERYLRVNVSGTFSNFVFFVAVVKNLATVNF